MKDILQCKLRDRFRLTCKRAGITRNIENVFRAICRAYQQEHRAYHTLQHLEECFDLLDELKIIDVNIEFALWFHDFVYEPKDENNELKSAIAFCKLCKKWINTTKLSDIVPFLCILKTQHDIDRENDVVPPLICDIDLAILGSSPQRFAEYQRQIRQEYVWVSEEIYQIERKKVLQNFLERDRIYLTEQCYTRFEAQARENLKNAIAM